MSFLAGAAAYGLAGAAAYGLAGAAAWGLTEALVGALAASFVSFFASGLAFVSVFYSSASSVSESSVASFFSDLVRINGLGSSFTLVGFAFSTSRVGL